MEKYIYVLNAMCKLILCLINFSVIYWGPQSYLKRHGGPWTKMSWKALR